MAKQITQPNSKEIIYNRAQMILQFIEKQKKILSRKNLEIFLNYNDDLIVCGLSENTRYKNLNHFGVLTKILQKDWADVTENDLRRLVANIMT